MNQRANYKQRKPIYPQITSTKPIYPQIGAAVAHQSWRSVLFVLGEEERAGVWVLKTESDGKKKKKEKMGYRKGEAQKRRKRDRVKQGETSELARRPHTSRACADTKTKL